MKTPGIFTVGALLLLTAGAAGAEAAQSRCDVPPELTPLTARLDVVASRRAEGRPVTIVALGTATIEGHGLGGSSSYLVVLKEELSRLWPTTSVRVVGKTSAGPRAADQFASLAEEIAALQPDLIIWQPGAAEAANDSGPSRLQRYLERGLAKLLEMDADLIVMDLRFVKRRENDERYLEYLSVIHRTISAETAALFQRYAITKWLAQKNNATRSYWGFQSTWAQYQEIDHCTALILARSISMRSAERLPNAE